MKIIYSVLFIVSVIQTTAQQKQSFPELEFEIDCFCKLENNKTFTEMSKDFNDSKVIKALICTADKDDYEKGLIVNIDVYDLSNYYKSISPKDYVSFDKNYLESYGKDLRNINIKYKYSVFNNQRAIEYSFQQYNLPTKAIVFLYNKKSYIIQIGTRYELEQRFTLLKKTFKLL